MRVSKIFFILAVFVLFIAVGAPQQKAFGTAPVQDQPAVGTKGMVSSAHPLATEAGLAVLKKGGNAFDAAVAVASTLNVVEPMMSGMGGYGTILVYDAKKGEVRFLNPSGKIPSGLKSDEFRSPTPNFLENRRGAKSISTPGNVHAWEAMSKTYGNLPWAELFNSAIEVAENGYKIDEWEAGQIKIAFDDFPAHAKNIYGANGQPLNAGDTLVQKDLAASFRKIASEGAAALYGGDIGKKIDSEMKRLGGFLSINDLINDRAEWWEPIHIKYRGVEVYTASPPATAFPSLIRLGVMSVFDVKASGHNTFETLHRFIEVTKHAFADRLRYAGDPDVSPPPLDKLYSQAYWQEVAAGVSDDVVKPFEYPVPAGDPDQHTTHFVVADSEGNIVSATQTLGNIFGCRVMAEGTGIWLNNSLAYCTFEPKGNPMDAHPGRRKLSGDCPTIIMKNGKPWVTVGTPGGHSIGQIIPQIVMNMVDFDMNIYDAIASPRLSFVEPDTIVIDRGIQPQVIGALVAKGHIIRESRRLGNAHGLTIEYDASGKPVRFTGASDPRGTGLAKGY